MSKFVVTFFIPAPCLGITLGAIHYKQKPTLFSPFSLQSLVGCNFRFSVKVLQCFLLSLLLWPDGSITFFSRKSMNSSKGDSSSGVVPDALVYSRVLRDIYWQKFNGFLEDFQRDTILGWKSALCATPIKKTYFAQ